MQGSLIYLLLFLILLALQAYYFGVYRPVQLLAWLQQSTLVLCVFLLIPFTGYALYSQSGAKARLATAGFVVHPAIGQSLGLATGGRAQATWVFEVGAEQPVIREFYRQPENRRGWALTDESPLSMHFRRGSEQMTLAYRSGRLENSLIFMRSPL